MDSVAVAAAEPCYPKCPERVAAIARLLRQLDDEALSAIEVIVRGLTDQPDN